MKNSPKTDGLLKYVLPRLGEMLFIAVFLAVIGLGPRMMNIDGDLGRHLTLGNYILDSRQIPTEDVFSFTKFGDPLTPHEWLADVIFALAWRMAGLDGVVFLSALVIAITVWILYLFTSNISGMPLLAAGFSILGAAASSLHWLTRPHIFTILLGVIWTLLLERVRRGEQQNWIIFPGIMLLWVNLHGAFMMGLLIWFCYLVGMILEQDLPRERIRSILFAGLSSFAVTVFNPDGFGIWTTGFGFLGSRYLVGHTAEYLPPDFAAPSTWPFLILLIISIIFFAFSIKRIKFTHLFMVGGWALLALYSARNIPIYVVASVPFLAEAAADYLRGKRKTRQNRSWIDFQDRFGKLEKSLRSGLWSCMSVGVVGLLLFNGLDLDFDQAGNDFLPEVFPVQAVNWMEENRITGPGFNYFPWGGYLLYTSWPDRKVFIDGQTDFYGEDLTREYERVITLGEGWLNILDTYNINWILMPEDSLLINTLKIDSNWEIVYFDQTAAIMVRNIIQPAK